MRFQCKMYVMDQPGARLETCKTTCPLYSEVGKGRSNVCKHITKGDWITIVLSHVKKRDAKW